MPKRKKRHELPPHKRDWFLVSIVIIVMIIFFTLVFARYA